MRKVVFKIDDIAYFKKLYRLTEEQTKEIFTEPSFKAIYTLYGHGKDVCRYELTDYDGNKINLSDLNGYIRGIILSDCKAYFSGWKYHHDGATEPFGVISIEDTKVSNEGV